MRESRLSGSVEGVVCKHNSYSDFLSISVQYSSGRSKVVCDLELSVITQTTSFAEVR